MSISDLPLAAAALFVLSAVAAAAGITVIKWPPIGAAMLAATIALDRVASVGRLSPSDAAIALLAGSLALRLRSSDTRLAGAELLQVLFVGMFAWIALASLDNWTAEREVSWFTVAAQVAIVILIPIAVRTWQAVWMTLVAAWLGGMIAVSLGWVQIVHFLTTGQMLFEVDRPWLPLPSLGAVVLRMSGGQENPAQFAFLLVFPTVSLGAWLLFSQRDRQAHRWRLWLSGVFVFLLSGVLASFTRGAILAALLCLGAAFILSRRRPDVWALLAAAVMVVVLGRVVWVAEQVAAVNIGSIEARGRVIEATADRFLEAPLFGHGLGTQVEISGGVVHFPHSALLQSALDGGAVGLGAFLGAVVLLLTWLMGAVRREWGGDARQLTIVLAIASGVCATLVQTLFLDPTLHLKALWMPISLGIASIGVSERASARAPERVAGDV
jgi:hypothetical protein